MYWLRLPVLIEIGRAVLSGSLVGNELENWKVNSEELF